MKVLPKFPQWINWQSIAVGSGINCLGIGFLIETRNLHKSRGSSGRMAEREAECCLCSKKVFIGGAFVISSALLTLSLGRGIWNYSAAWLNKPKTA